MDLNDVMTATVKMPMAQQCGNYLGSLVKKAELAGTPVKDAAGNPVKDANGNPVLHPELTPMETMVLGTALGAILK